MKPYRSLRMIPALLALLLLACHGHQSGDLTWTPEIQQPTHEAGEGPLILVDAAHCNFHTADGRYAPFADLLRSDGYRVGASSRDFSEASLREAGADLLVIANALSESACKAWKLPASSAFRTAEIEALLGWIEAGGSLLLVADHMPFPGSAEELGLALGLAFIDGYARADSGKPAISFERSEGTLGDHEITEGIDTVVTFTGQGFRALREVVPILSLPAGTTVRLPSKAGKVTDKTPHFAGDGLLQGVVFERGKGRVAVFGEAAMFTAQEIQLKTGLLKFGMNAEGAEQNPQFALNLVRWLTAER